MTDFDYEILERKRLARQSKYRKRGSKSKKCPLSTDHMTQKQWKKKNGEIMAIKLNKPIPWREFKKLPMHVQKTYIKNLVDKFSVTATELGRLFGCTATTVSDWCRQDGINIRFKRGGSRSSVLAGAFERYFMEEPDEEEAETAEQMPIMEEPAPEIGICEEEQHQLTTETMCLNSFSLQFNGAFVPDMVYNSLVRMLPSGTKVLLNVTCEVCES